METITMRLPLELANAIYSFVGKSPTAQIIRKHFDMGIGGFHCECDLCGDIDDAKYFVKEAGQCEMCYIKENPNLETGLGRHCDICRGELKMYKWCRIYGDSGGEFCLDCYSHQYQAEHE